MVGPHPDTRPDADIRWQFQRNCTSASAPAPASGYPSAAAGIQAGILGYPPSKGPATDRLEGFPSSRRGTCTSSTGRVSFQPARHLYLDGWKSFLPAGEVLVPRRLEGLPSSRQGTCTLSAGRVSFQSARYMYLVDWKEALPVAKVHVPCRLEGNPSSRRGTCASPAGRASFQPAISPPGRGYPLGYPDTRRRFAEKGPSAPESAPAGGYPLAQAGIRQQITGIRDGYPSTISILHFLSPIKLIFCICLCAAGSSACKSGDEVAAAGVYRPGSKSLGEDTLLPFSASVPMDGHF
ncbi:hypothetical protein PGTUg99_037741 [Puccinia graminis f. sp. tritici]|uniref:Uncharacterized protein n=1 Tax=Puccinia graminis f. sp. tritici TaxID=56615 RepID=A0A5B0RBX5_PUCGR|nr:hypothetical protein PGTUg99_037741 [Puccinia graminis f. sp. tritici]